MPNNIIVLIIPKCQQMLYHEVQNFDRGKFEWLLNTYLTDGHVPVINMHLLF